MSSSRRYLIGLILALSLGVLGCEKDDLKAVDNFVVEAFLFAGDPVNDITIKSTASIYEKNPQINFQFTCRQIPNRGKT